VELQSRFADLRAKGIGLAAISYDPIETLAAFSKQRGITFPLLSDTGSATIKRYGILNPVPEWAIGSGGSDPAVQTDVQKYLTVGRPSAMMVGVAFPGTFMLDRQGRVTSRYFEDFYIERNTVSSILMRLGNSTKPVNATKITTGQLDVITYPSDTSLAAGDRVALAFEIQPHSGMHIYAQGASGYRPIALKIDPQPFVRVLPVKFPASEIYEFKPLNERVPVYRKPFAFVQEVILEGSPQAQASYRGRDTLTVTGTLEYQACDEQICYSPTSVPLSWTFTLRALVRERTP
jgi:peroxiredoxin